MKINGKKIQSMGTIGSMYANGYIRVFIDDEEHRMNVEEIVKMVPYFNFEVKEAKVYKHLINPKVKKC